MKLFITAIIFMLTFQSIAFANTKEMLNLDPTIKTVRLKLEKQKMIQIDQVKDGHVYIVNEDGTVTFIRSAKSVFVVNSSHKTPENIN